MSHISAFPSSTADGEQVDPRQFTCTLKAGERGRAVVRVAGELDIASAPQLDEALHRAGLRARLTVLDLRELTFMDSSGVRVIVRAAERAHRAKHRLTVLRGPSQIDRILTLTGAWNLLDTVDLVPPNVSDGGPQVSFSPTPMT